jgi:thymidylate synthase
MNETDSMEDFTGEDIQLHDYRCHEKIQMEMAV